MKDQACEPCAKRKVRCDKGEPCSNCKRRKQDQCTYQEASPFDRIKKLEALVQRLGGDPQNDVQCAGKPTGKAPSPSKSRHHLQHDRQEKASFTESRSKDPVVLEEDGQSFYLESRAWHGWHGNGQDDNVNREMSGKSPFLAQKAPNVFQGMLSGKKPVNLATGCPSKQDAIILWNTFNQRVNPVARISFSWALEPLRYNAVHAEKQQLLTDAEQAFVFSLYLISIVSLSDEDCSRKMHQSRSSLLSKFQMLCEDALSRTNIFCITDITVLKALTIYMMAGIDRLSTQSLWSLMGLVIRNAEKLGLHRDGALLGLSPVKTEERRRLWWQLQHLDLALAVRSGLTPLTLMADWDTKLPLNIEDDDISATMIDFPNERKGLTSMSYCLFTYWAIDQQRVFFHRDRGRFELSWQTNKSLSIPVKDSLISELEDGLNKNFLQYCDPIKPLDTLIQLLGRALICGMRMRILHPIAFGGPSGRIVEEHHDALLTSCMQSLEYNVALRSHPSIKDFYWLTEAFFPWQPFMCVLVEASQQNDESKTQRMWDLLSELYSTNPTLSRLAEDRRRYHAAELIVAAWKARQSRSNSNQSLPKPDFVTHLETLLPDPSIDSAQKPNKTAAQLGDAAQHAEPVTPQSFLAEQDIDADFSLDFQDIDWAFWSSID